jgi:EPS-associated MarR family transcriptional regulator
MSERVMPTAASPAGDDVDEARLTLLRLLERQPELSQRQLSQALGLSLGKTHYLLHALLDKGLVKARNFHRSDRKLAYAYVLTPQGLHEKLRMAKDFLASKEAEFVALQHTIATLRQELETATGQPQNERPAPPSKVNSKP